MSEINLKDVETGAVTSTVILGADQFDNAGRSIDFVGDLNGDGIEEILIGAPYAEQEAGGGQDAGAAYLVFGVAEPATVDLSTIESGAGGGFAVFGESASDYAGYSVAAVGDVNGDGLEDLAIGAVGADSGLQASAGAVYIVFGKADQTNVDLSDIAAGVGGFKITGDSGFYGPFFLGASIDGAGDVNGDGLADIVMGAPGTPTTFYSSAFVVFGKADGAAVSVTDIAAGAGGGFAIEAASPSDQAGASVAGLGDVNGDGLDDVAVGAPLADPNGDASGVAYVIYGKADLAVVELAAVGSGLGGGFAINGAAAGHQAGRIVSRVGDIDGDGFADIGVGAPFSDIAGPGRLGAVALVQGGDGTDPVSILSGAPQEAAASGPSAFDGADYREQLVIAAPTALEGADQSNVFNPGIALSDFIVEEDFFAVSTAYPPALPAVAAGAGETLVIAGDGFPNGRQFGDEVIDVGLEAALGAELTLTSILGADFGDEAGKSLSLGAQSFAVGAARASVGETGQGAVYLVDKARLALEDGVNLPPEITAPEAVDGIEDTPLRFLEGEVGPGEDPVSSIRIADDDSADLYRLTVSVQNGTLQFPSGIGEAPAALAVREGDLPELAVFLGELTYTPAANFNGLDTLTITVDELGSDGEPSGVQSTETVAINVASVNDQPVGAIEEPPSVELPEDGFIILSADDLSATDIDSPASEIIFETVSDLTTIDIAIEVDGVEAASFTQADIDAGRVSVRALPGLESSIPALVEFRLKNPDGVGTNAAFLTVSPRTVNDPPTVFTVTDVSVPAGAREVGFIVTVADPDAGASIGFEATVVAVTGNVRVAEGTVTNATVDEVFANNVFGIRVTGTLQDVSAALASLEYVAEIGFEGQDTVTVTVNDNGASGDDGVAQSATAEILVTVPEDIPFNQPPEITGPDTFFTNEDTSTDFFGDGSENSKIEFDDPDIGDGRLALTFSLSNRVLSEAPNNLGLNLNFLENGRRLEVEADPEEADDFIEFLIYTPDPNFTGLDTLVVEADDEQEFLPGGDMQAIEMFTISVLAVNDAPTVVTNLGVEVEDGRRAPLTGLLIATDVEDDDAGLRYTISSDPTKGSIERLNGSGVGISSFTQAEVDAGQIVYAADQQVAFTTDAFVFSVTDSGGASVGEQTALIDITAVNDPPVIEVPVDLTSDEDTPFLFDNLGIAVPDANKEIRISDPDAGANEALVSLFANNGDLTLAEPARVALVDGDGVRDEDLSFRAPLTELDARLRGLRFTPDPDFVGTASLEIEVSDLGASGAGGPQVTRERVEILFTPINDAPLIDETQRLFLRSTGVGELTSTILPVRDPEQGSGEITISLREPPEAGFLAFRSDLTRPITSFTYDRVERGDVVYVPDAGFAETEVRLRFEARDSLGGIDGTLSRNDVIAEIDIVAAPSGPTADPDLLMGSDAPDLLLGQEGDDTISGGAGNDTLLGGPGADELAGDQGRDLIEGGGGKDTLTGGGGRDTLNGGGGRDDLNGGGGRDLLMGAGGRDLLDGGGGRDNLIGGGGKDTLNGGVGRDVLNGGGGRDVLEGGRGADTLMGGGGGDIFEFSARDGVDLIGDFQDGRDKILLTGSFTFADLSIRQIGDGTEISAARLKILLEDIAATEIEATDFIFGDG